VLWGYGTFALLIAAFVNNSSQISRALNCYRKFLRWYLPVLPAVVLLSAGFRDKIPTLPWAHDVNIIALKGGDAAVHLAAAGLFLLLFPEKRSSQKDVSISRLIGFVGWALTALIILIDSRAGSVAIAIPLILASVLKAQKIGWKVVAFAVIGAALILTVVESNLITIRIKGRIFTPDQIGEVVGSAVGLGDAAPGHEGTKAWRLIWWQKIIHYTVFGPYFWTGKGFGVNLAVEDGPPGMTQEESALRSPHNGNMTVLARMGIPGTIIWATLNLVFVFRLFKAYRVAVRSGSRFWSGVNLWILCYWLAAFINMSFDVYLEGPAGGIWFWSIIGLGVAAMRVQTYEARRPFAQARIQAAQAPDLELSSVHA
jgi:hypothetical protein